MKQNIYDNQEFFLHYKQLRDDQSGLNEVLEEPAMRALLPELRDRIILDLGCGFGGFEQFAVAHGARHVTAVDISRKMLVAARERVKDSRVEFVHAAIEDFVPAKSHFDLAVSSLCLHYLQDIDAALARLAAGLKAGGEFVFSIEHPMCTSLLGGWVKDQSGRKRHWPVDRYFDEGARVTHWFVDGVIKYHRTIESYVRSLALAGFVVTALGEPAPAQGALAERPDLLDETRRPAFLVIKAKLSK